MRFIGDIFALGLVGLFAFLIYDIIRRYKNAVGTMKERLLAAGHDSATMLLMKFVAILATVVGGIDQVSSMVGLPQVETYMNAVIANPKTVAGIMLGIAAAGAIARARTL